MISETARQRLHLLAAIKDALDGMEDMIDYVPEYFQGKWDHRAYIDRAKAVLAEFGHGPEGGTCEPAGDSPDSPPAGESGVRRPGCKCYPVAFAGDDPRDKWEHITPVSPEEFMHFTPQWPAIPAGYKSISLSPAVVSLDGGESWYEVPEGTSLSEFLAELRGN